MSQGPSGSRPPPRPVQPLVHAGVSYEQDMSGLGGGLVAKDAKTGKELWRVRVYEVKVDPAAPGAMPVYFRAMTLAPEGTELIVEDEVRRTFSVDLATHAVRQTGGPGGSASGGGKPAPGGKPKPD